MIWLSMYFFLVIGLASFLGGEFAGRRTLASFGMACCIISFCLAFWWVVSMAF